MSNTPLVLIAHNKQQTEIGAPILCRLLWLICQQAWTMMVKTSSQQGPQLVKPTPTFFSFFFFPFAHSKGDKLLGASL